MNLAYTVFTTIGTFPRGKMVKNKKAWTGVIMVGTVIATRILLAIKAQWFVSSFARCLVGIMLNQHWVGGKNLTHYMLHYFQEKQEYSCIFYNFLTLRWQSCDWQISMDKGLHSNIYHSISDIPLGLTDIKLDRPVTHPTNGISVQSEIQ